MNAGKFDNFMKSRESNMKLPHNYLKQDMLNVIPCVDWEL